MPIRNPDPPSRIPLEQTLDHGGPQKTERDKLRLRRWLAAHPSCPYPIAYSVALHHALGITDVHYAGALFQRLSRSGLPENCTTERFYLKAVATKNFRFVRLGPLDEGLPVRAVFMASLLHCVDQLRVDQHRLVDGCIVKGVATTEDEKAAMGALVFHLAAFPQAYDALRTSTAWATIAAEEDCATLLACLLKAAQAGALIVEGMLDMGHPDDAVSILSQLTTANEKMPGVASKSNAQLSAMLRRRWSAGAGDVVKYNGSRYWIVDDGHTNLTKTICLTPVRRAVAVAVAAAAPAAAAAVAAAAERAAQSRRRRWRRRQWRRRWWRRRRQ